MTGFGAETSIRRALIGRAKRYSDVAWLCLAAVAAIVFGAAILLWFSQGLVKSDVEVGTELSGGGIVEVDFHARDVAIGLDGTVIVVGSGSYALTFDEDSTHLYPGSGSSRDALNSVAISSAIAVAVGEEGLVLVSMDSGRSWTDRSIITGKAFHDVALSKDGQTIIAVGEDGLLRISMDGGESFVRPKFRSASGVPVSAAAANLNGVVLGDGDGTAIAAGGFGTILFSEDSGRTWTPVVPDDDQDDLEAVALGPGGRTAVVVGESGTILVSEDFAAGGNADWKNKGSGDRADDFEAVAFSGNGQTAIAVGRKGVVWRSTDGGKSWVSGQQHEVSDDLNDVALNSDGTVSVASGDDGIILVSLHKGRNWTIHDSTTSVPIDAVAPGYGPDRRDFILVGRDTSILRLDPALTETAETTDTVSSLTESLAKSFEVSVADDTKERDAQSGQAELAIPFLVSLFGVRLGIVLFALFMVQYLTNLARYCFKLSAFYHARADAINLADISHENLRPGCIDDLERMAHAMTPYGADLGRAPRSVTELAMDMARLIAGHKSNVSRPPSQEPGRNERK